MMEEPFPRSLDININIIIMQYGTGKFEAALNIVKLREREGQGVDPGRSLKGHLWMVDGGWWYTFP